MNRRAVQAAAIVAVAAFGVWLLFVALPRRYRSSAGESPAAPPAGRPPRPSARSPQPLLHRGGRQARRPREVPFGEPSPSRRAVSSKRSSLAAPAPLAAAVPDGTTLRGGMCGADCDAAAATCQRDAFVDLSAEARNRHTGGALDELFTTAMDVDAVNVSPAISRVQILVDGKEVDTLAGHVDLRHPLEKNLKWVKTEKED